MWGTNTVSIGEVEDGGWHLIRIDWVVDPDNPTTTEGRLNVFWCWSRFDFSINRSSCRRFRFMLLILFFLMKMEKFSGGLLQLLVVGLMLIWSETLIPLSKLTLIILFCIVKMNQILHQLLQVGGASNSINFSNR